MNARSSLTHGLVVGVCVAAAWLCSSGSARALMADNGRRTQTAGIDLITYRTHVKQVVVILGALPAGDAMAGTQNIAVPTLTGMMLDRGTRELDKFAIAEQLDGVGAQISFGVGTQSLEIRAKCLNKDLPLVLRLLAAELRTPAFSAGEFDKAKAQFIGALRESLQSTEGRAREAFARAVFPAGHPNHPHSTEEYIAAAEAATLEDVRRFHARYYGPKNFTLVLAGDVPEAVAEAQIAREFAGWSGGEDYIRPAPAHPGGARKIAVPLEDKPSVSVLIGQATGLRYRDPDALPLRIGTAVLGHGFTGRLMGTVRDQLGLTYGIDAAVSEDTIADGAWDVSATFAPALLERGLASTQDVLQTWWRDGITDTELAARKHGIVGGYLVSLSTTGGLANAILTAVQRGYGLDWLDRYPTAVEAVTREQVNHAIRAHLDPGAMIEVEAGSVSPTGAPAGGAPAGGPRPLGGSR